MALVASTYGKGRVRVMRVARGAERHEARELDIHVMLTGGFDAAFTSADNSACISTDTMKNLVNIVARENLGLDKEAFALEIVRRFFARYAQVETVTITARETTWVRMVIDGVPHPHGFVLDANGKPFVTIAARRGGEPEIASGIENFTFMKTTESGWANYVKDSYTTIRETDDRIAATAMKATWRWSAVPDDYGAASRMILDTMLKVFATTYSASVQDSLYRMGEAALAAVPEIDRITLACPNKHYLPVDLSPFGLTNENAVFLPTDEPHGQIECTVGRG